MFPSPDHVTHLGIAHYRYRPYRFGIRLSDRLMHMYIIGQTGTGKSTLLFNMAQQDAGAGIGFCLLDPHGDLADLLSGDLGTDHLYWNVADPESPYGYNPLTRVGADFRPLVASGFIETLKKQWKDAWGARMEHLLRYAVLALLEQPNADMRQIVRLFIEKDFRRSVVARVTDPQVYAFWTREYPKMNYQNAADGVAPIANKLGAFLASPTLRRSLCEPQEPLRFRQIMDKGQSLVINLAKGRLGSDNANVMGGLIVSSVLNAALTRHNLPETERRPFIFYIDEFHAFTTSVFAGMLAEARKYGIGLTLAHQHIVQTDREVFEAVLGNAGTLIIFRVGAQDAPRFHRQLGSVDVSDLVYLPNHRAFVQLMVRGERLRPFTMTTEPSR
ncbi:hypothetical protein DDZ14_02730 [Maritimibacter sp. 55A14]|uniref:type IV secretory system conjugative DNA transfer family protein n=1 Tax=Maritimibacter sp. 55A14 TaxID=2174844 RepID=UPI000D607C6F|nr:type IV secretion system DNA-binding domain-containing protein [Maritimibacter sp. 55A14]PWE34090.1 hypothetical protein DDZ14_02730 [Maritimibacter sp. 55A14]